MGVIEGISPIVPYYFHMAIGIMHTVAFLPTRVMIASEDLP
ncbi:MAG: hypothetical protein AB1437_00780 [Pseudomonadota bacterium]